MVRRWSVVAGLVMLAVVTAGCDGGGSGSTTLPTLPRKDWTRTGLAAANAIAARIDKALPGQCANPAPNDFSQFPISMKQFNSSVVPTGQVLCDVNGETVEISVFSAAADRDRFVSDRSNGVCRRAKEQAAQHKQPLSFPGLRWTVGAGNIVLQPDSQSLAARLAEITGGRYVPRPCAPKFTMDWDAGAVRAAEAVGARITAAGKGCDVVTLIGREMLMQTRLLTNAQLPAAVGQCQFAGSPIEIITYTRTTPDVTKFIAGRVTASCSADPALGRIDGAGFTVLAGGTIAEQVPAATGGTLATTTCTGSTSP
jgi:hypothetical protein